MRQSYIIPLNIADRQSGAGGIPVIRYTPGRSSSYPNGRSVDHDQDSKWENQPLVDRPRHGGVGVGRRRGGRGADDRGALGRRHQPARHQAGDRRRFRGQDGGWKGDISIPLQGAKDLPLDKIAVAGTAVSFAIPGIPGDPAFKGTLSADGLKITGDFSQGGGAVPLRAGPGGKARRGGQRLPGGIDEFVDRQPCRPGTCPAGRRRGQGRRGGVHEGFRLRDVDQKLPVTADTLFAIGSSTKAFTTCVMGTLVDEGKLDWDEPVRNYIPWFKLDDPSTTERITPRDLVTHRTGMPRHDAVWYNNLDDSARGAGGAAAVPAAQRRAARQVAVQQPDVPDRGLPGRASPARPGRSRSASGSSAARDGPHQLRRGRLPEARRFRPAVPREGRRDGADPLPADHQRSARPAPSTPASRTWPSGSRPSGTAGSWTARCIDAGYLGRHPVRATWPWATAPSAPRSRPGTMAWAG